MKRLAIVAVAALMVSGIALAADCACVDTCTWVEAHDYWIDAQTGVKIGLANVAPPAQAYTDIAGGCCGVITGAFLVEREVCQMTMCNGMAAVKKVLKSRFLAKPAESCDQVSVASGCHYWQLLKVVRCVKWDPVAGCGVCGWMWAEC